MLSSKNRLSDHLIIDLPEDKDAANSKIQICMAAQVSVVKQQGGYVKTEKEWACGFRK